MLNKWSAQSRAKPVKMPSLLGGREVEAVVVGLDHKSGLSLSILSVDKRQVLALLQTTIHHLMLPSQQIHQLVWRSAKLVKLVKFNLQFRVEGAGGCRGCRGWEWCQFPGLGWSHSHCLIVSMQMCRIEKLKCVGSFVKITHYTNTLHRHYTSHWLHCIPTRSTALSDGDNVSGRLTSKLWNVCQHLAGIWRQKQIFSHWAPPAPAGWEEAVHNRLILIDISNHCPPPPPSHPPPPSALCEW